jgi:D-alanine-D-alanine ligase
MQQRFGHVALLYGGWSAERAISLNSGSAVLKALEEKGVNVTALDAGRDVATELARGNFDRAFIILHGRGGEDGQVQGLLEVMGLPYTGSDVMASAICMNKLMTKRIWRGAQMPTPAYRIINQSTDLDQLAEELGLPMIIKPANEGSSIGMNKVESVDQLRIAYQEAAQYDCDVFAEQWVTGKEYTVSVLGGEALPAIRLSTPKAFYNYEAKYESNDTEYLCPCGLPAEQERTMQQLALEAFDICGASGWGRVDLMLDEQGRPYLIEINTVPGMTDHSLVPMAARQAGIEFDDLVIRILETTLVSGEEG